MRGSRPVGKTSHRESNQITFVIRYSNQLFLNWQIFLANFCTDWMSVRSFLWPRLLNMSSAASFYPRCWAKQSSRSIPKKSIWISLVAFKNHRKLQWSNTAISTQLKSITRHYYSKSPKEITLTALPISPEMLSSRPHCPQLMRKENYLAHLLNTEFEKSLTDLQYEVTMRIDATEVWPFKWIQLAIKRLEILRVYCVSRDCYPFQSNR